MKPVEYINQVSNDIIDMSMPSSDGITRKDKLEEAMCCLIRNLADFDSRLCGVEKRMDEAEAELFRIARLI